MTTAIISLGLALHSLVPAAVRRHSKHRRSKSMPISRVDPILDDFQNQLGAKMEILMQQQHQQAESYNFSAAWLGQALEVVLFTYSSVEDLYQHMQIDNNIDGKWLSQHMEDMVNLLDVCNVLREIISEIKKHNFSVQIALHGLIHADAQIPCALSRDHIMNTEIVKAKISSLGSCLDALRRNKELESKLEKCMSTLKRMADSLHPAASIGRSGVEEAIKEAKAITIFACTSLVAAFSFNKPCHSFMTGAGFLKKKKNKMSASPLPVLIDNNCIIQMIQSEVKEIVERQRKRSSTSKLLLQELDRADFTVGNLNNLLDRQVNNMTSKSSSKLQDELKDSIDAVNVSTIKLESALTHIDQKINDLYRLLSALTHIDQKINDLYRLLISSRVTILNSLTPL